MPIHPRGYRKWEGALGGPVARTLAIARGGIGVAWRNRWLRRFLALAWTPFLVFTVLFYMAAQLTEPEPPLIVGPFLRTLGPEVADLLRGDPGARAALWAVLLYWFLNSLQHYLVLIVVALVAPGLVAADRRHHAHEVYFARPVGWTEYVLGKWAVLAAAIGVLTFLPAMLLYAVALLVSPSASALFQTADLPLRLAAIGLLWSVGVGLPALALSSLGTSSRLVAFLWIVLWIGSELVSRAVRFASLAVVLAQSASGRTVRITTDLWRADHWSGAISISGDLAAVAHGLLGVDSAIAPFPLSTRARNFLRDQSPGLDPWLAFAVLAGLAVASLLVLRLRIRPEGSA